MKKSNKRRVVITGIGATTSYGIGTTTLWKNLLKNTDVIKKIPDSWKTSAKTEGFYAPLPKHDYKELGFSKSELLQYEPVTLNALLSVKEALDKANIPLTQLNDKLNRYRIDTINLNKMGVFGGTGIGGIETLLNSTSELKEVQDGAKIRLDALGVAKTMPYNIAAAIGIKLGLHRNINSHTYACATGTIVIGKAFKEIQNNHLDIVLTCTSEYTDQKIGLLYNGFLSGRTLTNTKDASFANVPFDERRNGFLFSEGGSGALVLESLEHAKKRDANILAEIVGFSDTFDGFNIVSLDPSGEYIEEMLLELLSDAKVSSSEINYINAHGTGTIKNDQVEAMVIERIFDENVAINSTKSLLGHTISASGSIEAIVTALSVKNKIIHENSGLKQPISRLNFVTKPTELEIKYAISQSFAFGGHNGALLFKRYEG